MALSDILELIAQEAEETARKKLSEADLRVREIKDRSEEQVKLFHEKKSQETARLADDIRKKGNMQAKAKARAIVSRKKHEILSRLYESVLLTLSKAEGPLLEKVFENFLSVFHESSGTIVLLGVGEGELKKVLERLQKKFSVEVVSGKGGFLFRGDGFEVDCSFENILRKIFLPKYEGKLLHIFFEE
jgi:vacuolar-type H+-ATPase subunit E/Vma4